MPISPAEENTWLDEWLAKHTTEEIKAMETKIAALKEPNTETPDAEEIANYRKGIIALFVPDAEMAVSAMIKHNAQGKDLAGQIASLSAFKERVQTKVAEKAKAEAIATAQAAAAPTTATADRSLPSKDSASAAPPPLPPKPRSRAPLSGTAAGGAVPAAAGKDSKQPPAGKERLREGTAELMEAPSKQQQYAKVKTVQLHRATVEEMPAPVRTSAPAGTKLVSASPSSPVDRLTGITLQANSQKAQFASGPSGQPLTLQHNAQKAQSPQLAEATKKLTTANTNAAIETVKKKLQDSIEAYNNKRENKNANKKLDLVEYDNGTLEVYLNVGDKPPQTAYTVEPAASGVKITFDPVTPINDISAKIAIAACESPVTITQSNNLEDLKHLADAAVASGKKLELSPQVLAFLKNKPEFQDPKNAEKYKNLKAVYETHSGPTVDAKGHARNRI